MVALIGLNSVGGPGAGFLLPVFAAHANANHAFIQRIDAQNNVSELLPVLLERPLPEGPVPSLEVDIGQPGIWAFRDETGEVHIGDAEKIQHLGSELLARGGLATSPMAAAELVQFCSAERRFPSVLKAAFAGLAAISRAGAETWLDTMILLPAIKADLSRNARSSEDRRAIREVIAVTQRGVTNVYGDQRLAGALDNPTDWSQLAQMFDIAELRFHPLVKSTGQKEKGRPQWIVTGIGGIARFVLKRAPYYAALDNPVAPRGGAYVKGSSTEPRSGSSVTPPLLIGISGSNLSDVQVIQEKFAQQSNGSEFRHLINIRPTGFGTPKTSKASPQLISESLDHFDTLWLITAHRLRQTGTFTNAMSASNVASRFVRAALSGLIWSVRNNDPAKILSRKSRHSGIGLVGAARYIAKLAPEEMIGRVLYSMLCEEAPLHSAQRIALLWPYTLPAQETLRTIQIGRHQIDVELFPSPRASGAPDVIGFAMNVRLSKRTPSDFTDFCVSIASGYNWRLRDDDGQSLIFEHEGEAIRLWPITEREKLGSLVRKKSEFGSHGDLIVTNQTLTDSMRQSAKRHGWGLAHFSEMERWMRSNYHAELFADW
jgi:hypothetical protein